MYNTYTRSEFIGLTFYFTAPYSLPGGNARASYYGFSGTPSVMFNGVYDYVGGAASGSMFSTYQPYVISELAKASPLTIDSGYVLLNGQVTVTTDIAVDQATSGAGRQVLFFVTQMGLHSNLNMVVDILPVESFTLTTPGESVSIERTFAMDPAWDQSNLNIVVVVQNSGTKEVYQAGQAIPDYAGSIAIDCEPNGVDAGWHITGPGLDVTGHGDHDINVFAVGQYTLTWEDQPYWDSPVSPQVQTLIRDGAITFTGAYTNGPFTALATGPLGDVDASSAISLVDVDNDGDLDVHMTSAGTGDLMLRNDGANVFTNLAASPLAAASDVRGAAWADINGDGNLDVYLTRNNQANQLYTGDGLGGFTLATTIGDADTAPSASAAWIDYDLDGILDLSVTNEGTENRLLKSQGEIVPGMVLFTSITGAFSDGGNGSCVVWGDGDLDGRPDPFLLNKFSGNVLFQNTTFGFSDLTDSQGMGNLGNSKGAAWGDYDNDGDLDLYLANDGQADVLYKCTGPFQYTQIPGANLADMGHGRGVLWADMDNDSNLDLYVSRFDEPDLFLLGDGLGGFARVAVGPDEATFGSNAVACGDMNSDGLIDIVVSREGAANVMFINGLDNGNNWSQLKLTAAGDNTQAVGARVVLTAGGVSQTRFISPGSGYLSSSAMDPHFGLAASTTVSQIDIYWPSGLHQVIGAQPANQVLAITEGIDLPSAVGDDLLPSLTALTGAYPNPFNPSTTISFSLKQDARAMVEVYTVDGRHVRTLTHEDFAAGIHQVVWTGTDNSDRPVASGTYLYRLTTDGGFDASGSMVLVK